MVGRWSLLTGGRNSEVVVYTSLAVNSQLKYQI